MVEWRFSGNIWWKFQQKHVSVAEVVCIILQFDGIPVLLISLLNIIVSAKYCSKDFFCEGICMRMFLFYHWHYNFIIYKWLTPMNRFLHLTLKLHFHYSDLSCVIKNYFFSFGIEVTEYPALLVILNYSEGTMNYNNFVKIYFISWRKVII